MSYLITVPDVVQGAAQDLAGIRALLTEAAATAGPTTGIAASAGDEVSIAIASLFGSAGQQFQALNAQAQAFQAEFESLLRVGAAAYVGAEAANAGQLLGNAVVGGAPAAAAAVPAATYRTFNLFNGALDINIGTDGILFTLSTPGIIVPAVHIPPINVAAFNLPQLTIPSINIPAGSTVANVTVSPFSLPQLSIPSINIPAGTTPANITVGAFDLPQITTPAITVPPINLPAVTIPAFQTPLVQVTGWSLPSITVPQINLPQIQIPDINVPGGGQTVVHLHTGNVLFPDYDINLQSFDFAPSLGFNTPGYITQFGIPSIQIGAFTLPFLSISNPSGGSYVFPSVGLSGFSIPSVTVPPIGVGGFTLPQVSWPAVTTAPLTVPPIGVGGFTLPQVSWPGFATAPLTIPPIGVGGFSLPDVNIPNITLAPVQQQQFIIPPIPTWLNGATYELNNVISIARDVAASLLGVSP
ncbi:PE family protein [Mycobacterium sp. E3198]|uniref:PE family protein n=1 Tax=Mycobacterium sp. E3198 TaxID=1834143 RepID=UPI000AE8BE9C|nr:PE family protein [Mycobacterium sp. E3198]